MSELTGEGHVWIKYRGHDFHVPRSLAALVVGYGLATIRTPGSIHPRAYGVDVPLRRHNAAFRWGWRP